LILKITFYKNHKTMTTTIDNSNMINNIGNRGYFPTQDSWDDINVDISESKAFETLSMKEEREKIEEKAKAEAIAIREKDIQVWNNVRNSRVHPERLSMFSEDTEPHKQRKPLLKNKSYGKETRLDPSSLGFNSLKSPLVQGDEREKGDEKKPSKYDRKSDIRKRDGRETYVQPQREERKTYVKPSFPSPQPQQPPVRLCYYLKNCKKTGCKFAHDVKSMTKSLCRFDNCNLVVKNDLENGLYTNAHSDHGCVFWHKDETDVSYANRMGVSL
jgi:hypothetical protein